MGAYYDRYGHRIRVGDAVAHAVSLNQERYPEGFTTHVCRKNRRGRMILDGSIGWIFLADAERRHLAVIRPDTDLRVVTAAFIRENYRTPPPCGSPHPQHGDSR